MTAQSFPNRRLRISACVALASLMFVLGVYVKAGLQSRALEREMAAIRISGLVGGMPQPGENAGRVRKNTGVAALGL